MVRKATKKDVDILAILANKLWKDCPIDTLKKDIINLYLNKKAQFFLKYEKDIPIGFAQCQLRYDYVEGTKTSPVGYLEGIFIEIEYRNKGYARELLKECEQWSRENGCKEFASDCEFDNKESFLFHKAADFNQANIIICFTKSI